MYRVRGDVFDRVVSRLNSVNSQQSTVNSYVGAEILDVGSGTGFYVDRWLRLGARVTGLDLTEVAVRELGRSFPQARFVQGDIGAELEPLTLTPASFDAVSAFDVLFHIV